MLGHRSLNAQLPPQINLVLYLERGLKWEARRLPCFNILLLAAVVVVVDLLFFRNYFWERLAVNIGILLIFAAFYFRFLKRP